MSETSMYRYNDSQVQWNDIGGNKIKQDIMNDVRGVLLIMLNEEINIE